MCPGGPSELLSKMCRSTASRSHYENGRVTVAFEVRTELPATPEQAFDLSLDVEAHTESMAQSGERAIRGVTQGRLGLDDEVTWKARHFGVPWTMTSKIAEWERPLRFVDEQVTGPFAEFRHEHLFAPSGGGTTMLDRVAFRAPFGVVGRLSERLLPARYLRYLIEARNAYQGSAFSGFEADGVRLEGAVFAQV